MLEPEVRIVSISTQPLFAPRWLFRSQPITNPRPTIVSVDPMVFGLGAKMQLDQTSKRIPLLFRLQYFKPGDELRPGLCLSEETVGLHDRVLFDF